jgi:hypothetical protein
MIRRYLDTCRDSAVKVPVKRYKASKNDKGTNELNWKSFFALIRGQRKIMETCIFGEYNAMLNNIKSNKKLNFVNPNNGMVQYYSNKFALDMSEDKVMFRGTTGFSSDGSLEYSSSVEGGNKETYFVEKDATIISSLRSRLSPQQAITKLKLPEDLEGSAEEKVPPPQSNLDLKETGADGATNISTDDGLDSNTRTNGEEDKQNGEEDKQNGESEQGANIKQGGKGKENGEPDAEDGQGNNKDKPVEREESESNEVTDLSKVRIFLYIYAYIGSSVKVGSSGGNVQNHVSLLRRSGVLEKYAYFYFGEMFTIKSLEALEIIVLCKFKESSLNLCFDPETELKDRSRSVKCELFKRFKREKPIQYPMTVNSEEELNQIFYGVDRWQDMYDLMHSTIISERERDLKACRVFASSTEIDSTQENDTMEPSGGVFASCPALMSDPVNVERIKKRKLDMELKNEKAKAKEKAKIEKEKMLKISNEKKVTKNANAKEKKTTKVTIVSETKSTKVKKKRERVNKDTSASDEKLGAMENCSGSGCSYLGPETNECRIDFTTSSSSSSSASTTNRHEVNHIIKKSPPWSRIEAANAVTKFCELTNSEMTKTLIVGIDDAFNCAQLIVRIFDRYPESSITIIDSNKQQMELLEKELNSKMAKLMTYFILRWQLNFKKQCIIMTDFLHNFELQGYKHMYVLSSGN